MAFILRLFCLLIAIFCTYSCLYIMFTSDQFALEETSDQIEHIRELASLKETGYYHDENNFTQTNLREQKFTTYIRIDVTTSSKPKEKLLGWREKYLWKSELDQHEYRYVINPENICKQSANITLLVLVKTIAADREERDMIRMSYGQGVTRYNVSAKNVFLVGTTKETSTTEQAQLQEEATTYGDILQEDFIDSYYNLTTKLIMGFKWASTFCANAQFVMSTDDDVVVDIVNLVNDLVNLSSKSRSKFVLAEPAIEWKVHRNPGDKWYTPKSFYSKEIWPPFPRGFAYIVSQDVGYSIYRESQKFAPVAPWDDVYCGFLLERLGIEMEDIESWFKGRHNEMKQRTPLKSKDHYAILGLRGKVELWTLWKAIEKRYKNTNEVSESTL